MVLEVVSVADYRSQKNQDEPGRTSSIKRVWGAQREWFVVDPGPGFQGFAGPGGQGARARSRGPGAYFTLNLPSDSDHVRSPTGHLDRNAYAKHPSEPVFYFRPEAAKIGPNNASCNYN